MFDWLKQEVSCVRWRNFFTFQQNIQEEDLLNFENELGPFPNGYREYLLEFGDSRLFRSLEHRWYHLAVLGPPGLLHLANGKELLKIGFFINGGTAGFKLEEGKLCENKVIYECRDTSLEVIADNFEDWLKNRFNKAKTLYSKSEWEKILAGAPPFNSKEIKIVEAIGQFSFEKVGVSNDRNVLIKVHNGSGIRLKWLTVGVRVPGLLDGGVWLDISDIAPGETKILAKGCYKRLYSPDLIELYRKPLPQPEERAYYHEFKYD